MRSELLERETSDDKRRARARRHNYLASFSSVRTAQQTAGVTMATTAETSLSDAAYWLGGDMKRWRIPRPKMTTSGRNGQQQERRPADPPRDYIVNDSTEQEISSNEGSPVSTPTNADD